MINCAPTTGTSREPELKESSREAATNLLRRRLSCLFITFFCMPTLLLLEPAKASYDRQLQTQESSIFNGRINISEPATGGYSETGVASWYGLDFHGRKTSSGERYDMHDMTAAHRLLPMDTLLLVRNLENGAKAIVRVNDRGPFVKGRILDLSQSAAKALKLFGKGTARVRVMALSESGEFLQVPPQDKSFDESSNGFYVQVGAFAREKNAEHLQKRFADAGHTTTVSKVTGKVKTIYKVLIYAGNNRDTALLAKKNLQQKGHKGAFVMAR